MRIIKARQNKGFVCTTTEEVWGYCTLTNEINAGGYLYLSWYYSKGNLGSVLTSKRKHEKREASSASQVQGVIDWLIFFFFACSSPQLVYINIFGITLRSTHVDYVLCGNGFYSTEY